MSSEKFTFLRHSPGAYFVRTPTWLPSAAFSVLKKKTACIYRKVAFACNAVI